MPQNTQKAQKAQKELRIYLETKHVRFFALRSRIFVYVLFVPYVPFVATS
jgi:hypothetical protein